MKKNNKIPDWLKLDNAATIYPSTLSKKYASMFRMTITLNDNIDKKILSRALRNIMKRFPTFRYELHQGLFWCYLKFIDGYPIIQNDYKNPMLRINFKENKGFMFRVRFFEKRIAVEYFHALTDGSGGITFLLTLTGEYLRLKENIKIKYDDKVLNLRDEVKNDEYRDSFKKYVRHIGKIPKEEKAYHYHGTEENIHVLNIITGTVPIDKIKDKAHQYHCTLTQFITSIMIYSLQEISEKDKRKNKKSIKVSIPINLRKIYPSKTMRNFSSYVNIGIDSKYGHYTFDEITKIVKNKMELMTSEKTINARITGNVKMANNYFIRLIPMFIKKHIMSFTESLMGDGYCSTTFSNLGLIEIPKSMNKYVSEMGFILGRSRGKPGSCSAISYKDNLYISFSRKIKEAEFERLFFTKLIEMDIPVLIESNGGRE